MTPTKLFVPRKIVIHHSLTKDGATVSWSAIRRYHRSWAHDGKIICEAKAIALIDRDVEGVKRPWLDIGYHAGCEMVVSGGRVVFECLYGRPVTVAGAHARGHNDDSLGFCFVGNFDERVPSQKMLEVAARRVIAPWCAQFGILTQNIIGHREVSNKTCPGSKFDMYELVEIVREELQVSP